MRGSGFRSMMVLILNETATQFVNSVVASTATAEIEAGLPYINCTRFSALQAA